MINKLQFLLISFLLIITSFVNAQHAEKLSGTFLSENSSVIYSPSEIISDTFHVYVKLPDNYYKSDETYPVLYLLDGDLTFPIAKGIIQYMLYGEHIPEMIIVGIGYGSLDWQTGNQRSRDYTPTQRPDRPYEGGAEKFYSYLKNELLPFINEKYNTDKTINIIFGHSLGGLFTTYTLLQKDRIFSHYILSSPYLWHNKKAIFNLENDYNKKSNSLNAEVFVSYGENELQDVYVDTINEFVETVSGRNYSGLNLSKYVIKDGEHFTSSAIALTFGLQTLFK